MPSLFSSLTSFSCNRGLAQECSERGRYFVWVICGYMFWCRLIIATVQFWKVTVQVSRGWEFQDISEMSEKFKIVSITKFMFELYTVKKKNGVNPPCWTWQLSQKHYGSGGLCLLCIWRLTISIAECDEDEWGLVCSRLRWWHHQSDFKLLFTNWYIIMFIFVSLNLSANVAEWIRIIDGYLKISEVLNLCVTHGHFTVAAE